MITVESWQGHDLNDSTYQSWLAIDDTPYAQAVGVVQQTPLVGPPRFVRSQVQMRTLPVHVNIIDGDFQAGWETLSQRFRPGTRGELVVMFAGSVRRAIDATVQQVIPYQGSPNRFTVVLHGHDPRWRSEDVQRTSQAVTASPTTWAVTNDGNTPEDAPLVRLQPYTRKAQADGQRYVREVVIVNRLARAFTNYAIELTNGGWDHAAAVSAGYSDSSGKDVRVLVDGVEVPRWDGEHADNDWNSAATKIWANIDLAPRRTVTLRTATTATSPLNGEDLEVYDGQIDALPERGAILIDDEVIEYAGKTARNANGVAALQHVIRGARNTTAAIHAVDATGYFAERRVQIVYGWTGAGTYTEPLDTKPLLDLTSSTLTNTRHEWTDFTDSRYPRRSMGWRRTFASRDDQSGKIVAATGGPLGAMAAQFYANGAQASKPVANQWERNIPSGLATSASALSFVNTRSADMGLRTIGVDADGNEVILDSRVGTASGATVNITPAAALYDVRFWTFNPIVWSPPGASFTAATTAQLNASAADTAQVIRTGDAAVVITGIEFPSIDDGVSRTITAQVYSGSVNGTAPVLAISGASGTVATNGAATRETLRIDFGTPPTLAPDSIYWIGFSEPTTAEVALYYSYPEHGDTDYYRVAGSSVVTEPQQCLDVTVFGYPAPVAPSFERSDTNRTPTDGNSTSIASVTAVLDSAGVPYVSMRGQQDAYVVAGTLRNVTTGQGLAFATAGALLDRYEVDVRERAVRNLAECPYALTLSGVITDTDRVAGGIAQPYLLGLTPAGLWGLGEASGDALDGSGNGNDGTVTLGTGARDAAAIDDGGDGAITFDGLASGTSIAVADDAALQNLFDGGGALMALFNPTGLGENNGGRLYTKEFSVRVISDGAGGFLLSILQGFSGTSGEWRSSAGYTLGRDYALLISYNADATTNDPTAYLYDLTAGTLAVLTVGSGLTETQTPVGTRNTDAGDTAYIGSFNGSIRNWAGKIDELALFTTAPTFAQFLSYLARVSLAAAPDSSVGVYDPARVRIPVRDLVTEEQGWVSLRWRPGWSNAAEPASPVLFDWRDASDDRITLSYDVSNNRYLLERVTAAGTDSHTFAATVTSGTTQTITADWSAAALGLKADGGDRTTAASTRIPTLAALQADLGQSAGASHLYGDLLHVELGAGVVADADGEVLYAAGDTDPDPEQLLRDLAPESLPRALWWCDGNRYFRLDRPADERGANVVRTVTPDDEDEWLRLDPGANRLAWEETGILGQRVEVLAMDRWT